MWMDSKLMKKGVIANKELLFNANIAILCLASVLPAGFTG